MQLKKIITSESVGPGHPDKICDQISDHILDKCLIGDKNSRVACEVFASNRLIVIGGEITTSTYVDVVKEAWNVLKPLGYNENDFTILSNINKQSPDIAQKVNLKNKFLGSGDQGIVYGYACDETKNYMPLSIDISHALVKKLTNLIKNKKIIGAKFDMKSQVSINYIDNQKPTIDNVIISVQHYPNINLDNLRKQIKKLVVDPIIKSYKLNLDFKCYINNGGTFEIGGPIGDTGLTGRKIIVDTYGGVSHHGGGAFSGKDYTKVDRTGAYFARKIAKHIVAAKLAKKCEIQFSFCIGEKKPLCLNVDTFGTNSISNHKIIDAIIKTFNFDLADVVNQLDLKNIKYSDFSVFGHFGREDILPKWEKLDKINILRKNIED